MNKFDSVWVFTSGLYSGHLSSDVVIIMDNSLARHVCKVSEVFGGLFSLKLLFKNNFSVSILGLYAGASLVVWFFQTSKINSFIAKAVNEFSFVILSGDFNENGTQKCASFKKCFDLGLVNSLREINAVVDGSVADVEDYFNTNHKAIYASMGLGGLFDIYLGLIYKQTSRKVGFGRFESLLRCWVSINNNKASVVWNLVSSGASLDCIYSALCGVRRFYYVSKLAKSLQAKKLGIRLAIEKRMESFVVNKGHTIHSVLECPFHKVVLDHLVSDNGLILDSVEVKNKMRKRTMLKSVPDLWQHQYLLLDYVNNNAFSGVMNAISLDDLMCVIKDLPDGKAAGLSGISNKLWKHCNDSVLDLLLDLLNICLMCESPYEWEDILTNTRPIALIETACKILFKLLSDRISSACGLFNSTTTQSLIFVIGLVVENALEKNYELWLVLQDMCKAYNFVGWHHLYNSLVWIKMCKHFIRFFGSIHNDCVNWVMTDFGLTNGYWVKRQESLYEYSIDTKFVARTSRIEHQDSLTLFLAAGAFVNDTIWVGSSQVVTQYILNTASEFFRVNNISINNKKTVAIPINQRVSNILLLISGLPISIARRKKFYQYFGIYLLSKSLSKQSLAKKAISDKQFLYLVSAVLQPIVSYRTQFSFISKNVCSSPFFFCKVAFVLCFLNTSGVLGRLFNHRSLDLQILGCSPIHSLCCLIRLHISLVNNFLAGVIRIFLNYDMSLDNLSNTNIYFYNVSSSLKKFGVAFAEQLYIKKDLIFDWKTFHHWKKLDPRGPVLRWFILVFSRLGQYFSSANMKVVNVYTDGLLRDLGLCEMKCDAAAYFLDLDLGIGAKVGGLVSLTMVKLQTIALALECVLSDSLVVVYSESQAALDACVAESALKKFIKTGRVAVSENIHHFAHEIFKSINHVCWEIGSGFNVIDDSLCGNVNWFYTALVWYPDFHMATGFTSKSTADLPLPFSDCCTEAFV
ncbi:hypothetical protein G9A89_018916 [Geosiphon pyriformis]|nr:hypothetical protein G9A89_018916 [Geosiphon pyriformis]